MYHRNKIAKARKVPKTLIGGIEELAPEVVVDNVTLDVVSVGTADVESGSSEVSEESVVGA